MLAGHPNSQLHIVEGRLDDIAIRASKQCDLIVNFTQQEPAIL